MMIDPKSFYQNTPDSDLTYTGNDPLVWDRINQERVRRGLPGLASIGFPRPLEETEKATSSSTNNSQSFVFSGQNNQQYEVSVPAGMSESEARAFFEKEFGAGKLTNLGIGQSLEGLSDKAASTLGQIAKLAGAAVSSPVNAAQILKQTPSTLSIGSLVPSQVTGLLAQAATTVSQAPDSLSPDKGVGKFGLTPQQLQDQGFLKPGTVEQFIGKGDTDFTSVLKSPACWTGKSGARDLTGFLSDTNLQNNTQQSLMTQGFDQLKNLGTITGKESAQQLSTMIQGSAKFGAGAMAAWSQGKAPADLVASINSVAKDAQFAVDLVGKLPDPASAIEGVTDTVNRLTVDNSIKGFVGNDKVPSPSYGPLLRQASQSIEPRLYQNTPNEDLIYTGDDPLVWDRVNQERLRRGLPSLTEIGIPKPPDTPTVYT